MTDDLRSTLDADFHRHISLALSLEWRIAAGKLPHNLRHTLREPGFALRPFTSCLGQWVGKPVREIRIKEALVTEHPWYAVVDVLRHEMAHQIAEEILGRPNDSAHDAIFKNICRVLGANAAASGSYPTLDEAVLAETVADCDRIMDRIRKLLALAESPNRHEAERAMAKARQLMAKHNIEPDQSDSHDYVTICLGRPRLRHGLDQHALAGLIRDACFVKTVWVPMAVPGKDKIGRSLEISGTREHAQMAHYVYDFINRVIEVEWKRYRKGRRLGRNGRRDFALGAIEGFRTILDKQTDTSAEIRALIRRGDPGLEQYFEERHPRTRKARTGRGVTVNPDLMDEGQRTAERVGFRPGVDAARKKTQRRLHQ